MNAIVKQYVSIAKAQNNTTNPAMWLKLEHTLLAIDKANNFAIGKVVRAKYPSL